VTRKLCLVLLSGLLSAPSFGQTPASQDKTTDQPAPNAPAIQQPPSEDEPPEEDESVKPRVYPFDPLEADRNIKVGNFYMHKGTPSGYRAAAGRYEDATKYNPKSAEAFLKLGQAQEKLKNKDRAKAAFERVVQIAPDSKFAREAKKKLSGLS
jgi:tetratricopeptide (TPR) repeat protein